MRLVQHGWFSRRIHIGVQLAQRSIAPHHALMSMLLLMYCSFRSLSNMLLLLLLPTFTTWRPPTTPALEASRHASTTLPSACSAFLCRVGISTRTGSLLSRSAPPGTPSLPRRRCRWHLGWTRFSRQLSPHQSTSTQLSQRHPPLPRSGAFTPLSAPMFNSIVHRSVRLPSSHLNSTVINVLNNTLISHTLLKVHPSHSIPTSSSHLSLSFARPITPSSRSSHALDRALSLRPPAFGPASASTS